MSDFTPPIRTTPPPPGSTSCAPPNTPTWTRAATPTLTTPEPGWPPTRSCARTPSGGTIVGASVQGGWHRLADDEAAFEDGTVNFLDFAEQTYRDAEPVRDGLPPRLRC